MSCKYQRANIILTTTTLPLLSDENNNKSTVATKLDIQTECQENEEIQPADKNKKRYSGKRLLAGYNTISAKRKEVRVSGILETERE